MRPNGSLPPPAPAGRPDEEAWARVLLALVDDLAAALLREARPPVAPDAAALPLDANRDLDAYAAFLARREPAWSARRRPPREAPVVTVAMPVHRPPLDALSAAIASVLGQSYPYLELCLCDDGSRDPEVAALLRDARRRDRRVRLTSHPAPQGIAAATNAAVALGHGEWVAFVDHDDELAPFALEAVVEALAANPEADVCYTDEDCIDPDGARSTPQLKPAFSPDHLLSTPFLGHLLVVRRSLLDEVGGLRSEFDGSQDYDLMLRATERARSVLHVPVVAYHWRRTRGSAAGEEEAKPFAHDASRRALEAALARRGIDAAVEAGPVAGWYHVRRRVSRPPLVSVVVPFRDGAPMLARCVESLERTLGGLPCELVLVDNGSTHPETRLVVERLERSFAAAPERRVLLLEDDQPFNWSALNNEAAARASGQVLCFLNDDVEATTPGWLEVLLGHALRPEVGAVGPRLSYPDGRVQSAGLVVGLGGIANSLLAGCPPHSRGYMELASLTRNCSAVTGACLVTRRAVFESVGGFDEGLAVAFNDVDYCLRLRQASYLVVFTPMAELVHHESESRGLSDDAPETARFFRRHGRLVREGDPYFNPNLSRLRPECALPTEDESEQWTAILSLFERLSRS
jgi:GT2 family glycosyltransferase